MHLNSHRISQQIKIIINFIFNYILLTECRMQIVMIDIGDHAGASCTKLDSQYIGGANTYIYSIIGVLLTLFFFIKFKFK